MVIKHKHRTPNCTCVYRYRGRWGRQKFAKHLWRKHRRKMMEKRR